MINRRMNQSKNKGKGNLCRRRKLITWKGEINF